MAKYFLLLFTLFLFACSDTTNEKLTCTNFRVGKFLLHSEVTNTDYVIERNDSIQVESTPATGAAVTFRIKWMNSCEYELAYISQDVSTADSFSNQMKTKVLRTKIRSTAKDYYIFESTIDGMGASIIDTLRVFRKSTRAEDLHKSE
jgi:hypothetical protein